MPFHSDQPRRRQRLPGIIFFMLSLIIVIITAILATQAQATPGAAVIKIDSIMLEQLDYPSSNWVAMPQNGTYDGNRVRVVIRLVNNSSELITIQLAVKETTTNTALAACPALTTVPPTGGGETYAIFCDWDTSGFAWSDDTNPQPLSERNIQVTLTVEGSAPIVQNIPAIVNPRPVFLVHDANADARSWDTYRNFFQARHPRWPVFAVTELASGSSWENPNTGYLLAQNVEILDVIIEQQRDLADFQQYDLIGHGHGGLIARAYLHSYGPGSQQRPVVRNLILIGTPNLGTPCALPHVLIDLEQGVLNTALLEQTPPLVAEFNRNIGAVKGAEVAVLAGDSVALNCMPFGEDTLSQPLPGDGWVDVVSAQGGFADLSKLPLDHGALLQNADGFNQVIVPRLAENRLSSAAPTATGATPQAAEATYGYSYHQVLRNTIAAGATVDLPFTAATADRLGLLIVAPGSVATTLLDPAGNTIATSTEAPYRLLEAENPPAGQWKLRLVNNGASPAIVRALLGSQGGSIRAEARLEAGQNDRSPLQVTLSNGGNPLRDATVTAWAESLGDTLTLRDDGRSNDGAANDGVYGVVLPANYPGLVRINVSSSAGNLIIPVQETTTAETPTYNIYLPMMLRP